MRVALDVSSFAFGVHAGVAMYLRRLAESLLVVDRSVELVLLYQPRRTPEADEVLAGLCSVGGGRVEVRYGGWRRTGLPARGGAWLPWQPSVRRLVGEVDVYHAGEGALPRPDGTPIVATVYDLTPELFPEYHTWLNRRFDRRRRRWLEAAAARVLPISEATGRDLARFHPALAERMQVVPLASAAERPLPAVTAERLAALRRAHALGNDPYVLSVGTLEPRKNHVRLVQAFSEVAAAYPGLRLVLAGRLGWKSDRILAAIAGSAVRDRIHLLGGVSDTELTALYRDAVVFAYPSCYEGFGLPVLEAMASGTPVITSCVSSLPEVAGDAALLVDPDDGRALAQTLARLIGDSALRATLSSRGRTRAEQFSWERTAEETLAAYRLAMTRR